MNFTHCFPRVIFISFAIVLLAHCVSGQECNYGACSTSSDSYNIPYCCTEEIIQSGLQTIIPVAIAVVVCFLAACCLCCFCCPCCIFYKRRHNGTVYGRVQLPETVVNVQQPSQQQTFIVSSLPPPSVGAMPMPQQGMPGPGNPLVSGIPDYPATSHLQQPPSYNSITASEGYVKQAPYNPNY